MASNAKIAWDSISEQERNSFGYYNQFEAAWNMAFDAAFEAGVLRGMDAERAYQNDIREMIAKYRTPVKESNGNS